MKKDPQEKTSSSSSSRWKNLEKFLVAHNAESEQHRERWPQENSSLRKEWENIFQRMGSWGSESEIERNKKKPAWGITDAKSQRLKAGGWDASEWRSFIYSGELIPIAGFKDLRRILGYLTSKNPKTAMPGVTKLGTLGFSDDGSEIVGRPSWSSEALAMELKPKEHRRHIIPWNLILESTNQMLKKDKNGLVQTLEGLLGEQYKDEEISSELEALDSKRLGATAPDTKEDHKRILSALFKMNSNTANLWAGGGSENIQLNKAREILQKDLENVNNLEDLVSCCQKWEQKNKGNLVTLSGKVASQIVKKKISGGEKDHKKIIESIWDHLWILPIDVGQEKADTEKVFRDTSWMEPASELLRLRVTQPKEPKAKDYKESFAWLLGLQSATTSDVKDEELDSSLSGDSAEAETDLIAETAEKPNFVCYGDEVVKMLEVLTEYAAEGTLSEDEVSKLDKVDQDVLTHQDKLDEVCEIWEKAVNGARLLIEVKARRPSDFTLTFNGLCKSLAYFRSNPLMFVTKVWKEICPVQVKTGKVATTKLAEQLLNTLTSEPEEN